MTKARAKAHELYNFVENSEKISEDFLYNAICYFETDPKDVVRILNEMPEENAKKLDIAFTEIRKRIESILEKTLASGKFSDVFHDAEIEDILFYQESHGYEIG